MTSYKLVFATMAAVTLVAACAKKEEAAAPEATPEPTMEAAPAPAETVPADPAASDANSMDAEPAGGDAASEPEPPPATN